MANHINVMEFIWQSVDKSADGCIYYSIEFIDFLWDHGFVDTKKFSRQTWRTAFEPFKQPNGSFKLSHAEFLSLEKYRYAGEINIPFDAMRINEGKYTDEGFEQLAEDSLSPSCSLEAQAFQQFVDALKQEFRQPDGLILIKANAKQKIKKLLEDNPSPLRRLELMFDSMLRQKGEQAAKQADEDLKSVSRTATPEQIAALQTSTFTTGPTSLSEFKADELKKVTKAMPAKLEDLNIEGAEPLTKMKRSRKGMRG
ncbi:MAG: hypothetical protein A3H42_05715 [Deltaproteobacteria bacterium RIFCSPLOWO2_02_FULL_46_8]|nr:MAG: hypothetical protein A3H42_05715 [Deltaproteobacteria bacterium RIFCSPLOWO2_02_FULL_46_8]